MTTYGDWIILHRQLHRAPIRRNDRLRLELLCDMFPDILQIPRFLFPVNDQHSIRAVLDISVHLRPKWNVQVVCRFFHISTRKTKDWYAFWYTQHHRFGNFVVVAHHAVKYSVWFDMVK